MNSMNPSGAEAVPRTIVVVLDTVDPHRLAAFWTKALGYRRSPSEDPYVVLVPDTAPGPDLVLQRVPEAKTVKNRMHLDVRVQGLDAEVDRLQTLGASRALRRGRPGGGIALDRLADPQGNEFCVGVGLDPAERVRSAAPRGERPRAAGALGRRQYRNIGLPSTWRILGR